MVFFSILVSMTVLKHIESSKWFIDVSYVCCRMCAWTWLTALKDTRLKAATALLQIKSHDVRTSDECDSDECKHNLYKWIIYIKMAFIRYALHSTPSIQSVCNSMRVSEIFEPLQKWHAMLQEWNATVVVIFLHTPKKRTIFNSVAFPSSIRLFSPYTFPSPHQIQMSNVPNASGNVVSVQCLLCENAVCDIYYADLSPSLGERATHTVETRKNGVIVHKSCF